MKRRFISLGALIVLTFVLLISTNVIFAQTKITLNYWDFIDPAGVDPRSIARNKLWEGFEEAHPNIKLNISVPGPSAINSELIKASQTNSSPDVVLLVNSFDTMHVAAGSIVPLDEYADELYKDDWVVPWEETGYYGGHKYLIPWDMRASVIYYRQDLFEESGLTVPETWEELANTASKLNTPDLSGFVMGLSTAEYGVQFVEGFTPMLMALGGKLFDEETNDPLFNSEEGVKAFQTVYDLIYKYQAMPEAVLGYHYNDVQAVMQLGRAAMMTLGTHRLETIRAGGLGEKVQIAPMPGYEGYDVPGPTNYMRWGFALGANTPIDHRKPEYLEAAIEFIKWAKSIDAELIMAEGGEIPARKSTWEDPRIKEKLSDFPTYSAIKTYLLEHGVDLYKPPKWQDASLYLVEAINKMVMQKESAENVLNEAAERYIKLVEE